MVKAKNKSSLIPDEIIMNKILIIRNKKVMIDRELAELYCTTTVKLNQQVKRNIGRFPDDFMFQLTEEEKEEVITKCDNLKSLKFSPHLPYVFTEYGAVMLASVLNSQKAIEVNVQIVRVFVKLRQMLTENTDLRLAIERLERKTDNNTKNVEVLFGYFDELSQKEELLKKENNKIKHRKLIGYKSSK